MWGSYTVLLFINTFKFQVKVKVEQYIQIMFFLHLNTKIFNLVTFLNSIIHLNTYFATNRLHILRTFTNNLAASQVPQGTVVLVNDRKTINRCLDFTSRTLLQLMKEMKI